MTRHWTFSGFDYRTRWAMLGCAVSIAILIKLFTVLDIVIVMNGNCTRIFQRYIPAIAAAQSQEGDKRRWLSNFLQLISVVLPFVTLVFLNGGIVFMLRHQNIQVRFRR